MRTPATESDLNLLFRDARTQNSWQDKPVPEELIRQMYDLMKMAPTSANCSPARFVFVHTPEGKEMLKPALSAGNLDKTMGAPLTAIIGYDMAFYDKLPELFPHTDARAWFTGNDALIKDTAFRNGSLQGAYLMMAARALGLDCGPMSGFDEDVVNETFFKGSTVKVNFLCNIGYGDDEAVYPRGPRLSFEDACSLV